MIPTLAQLSTIAGVAANDNMRSFLEGISWGAEASGLTLPHRLAHYISQWSHESGGFRYDREIWGPTAAQERYDIRTDLGNTPERDGDGELYMGRTGGMITGRRNYRLFTAWARVLDPAAPDFEADPARVNTDPWEGLGPMWYWDTNRINRYADENDAEMVTHTINGGYNGLADRLTRYTRTALVLLGRGPTDVRAFQEATAGLKADGIAGPRTRNALHAALVAAGTAPVTAPASPAASSSAEKLDRLSDLVVEMSDVLAA